MINNPLEKIEQKKFNFKLIELIMWNKKIPYNLRVKLLNKLKDS